MKTLQSKFFKKLYHFIPDLFFVLGIDFIVYAIVTPPKFHSYTDLPKLPKLGYTDSHYLELIIGTTLLAMTVCIVARYFIANFIKKDGNI